MKKLIPAALATLLLAGCSGMNQNHPTENQNPTESQNESQNQNETTATIKESDLLHHRFELQSVDGATLDAKARKVPSIEFGEKMHVSGAMCNRFMGAGQLENDVLTVKKLASTRMMCADKQLNQWDRIIGTVLANGAKVTLNGQQLTLNDSEHTLIYTLKDLVQ